MTVSYATPLRNDRLDLTSARLDAGAGPGTLSTYTAPRPATGAAITTQTLLVTHTFNDPCAPAASDGTLTFSAIADATAVGSGEAAWSRASDSDGAFVADLDVTATGAGGDVTLNDTNITAGAVVTVTSATLTEGNP